MKLKVNKNGELLDYLYNNLDMPKKKIKQYLTHGAIFVNNVKIRQYNYPIINGMEIVINTDSKNKKVLPFEVLFEDDNIIVVNKPAGLLTIATAKEKEKTLYHIVSDYLKSKDRNARVFIVHRLDKETSGVLVLAKNEKIKKQLQENWNEYVSLREYVAVVHGHLKEQEKKIIQNLKETKTNLVYVTKHNDGKEAITNYKVIKESKDTILFVCHLGIMNVLLSHLLNIPYIVLCQTFFCAPTGVTLLNSEEREKGIASFRCEVYGDTSHLKIKGIENSFSGRFCEVYSDPTRH